MYKIIIYYVIFSAFFLIMGCQDMFKKKLVQTSVIEKCELKKFMPKAIMTKVTVGRVINVLTINGSERSVYFVIPTGPVYKGMAYWDEIKSINLNVISVEGGRLEVVFFRRSTVLVGNITMDCWETLEKEFGDDLTFKKV